MKQNKLFEGKKVVIMGLGLHGGGVDVAKFFCKQGAEVLVTDLKNKNQLKDSLKKLKGLAIRYTLGSHREEDFINADLVIKNPAIHRDSYYLKVAKEHKIPIKTDINIFFDLCKAPIIGVTGTKGKSTVATLICRLLKAKYPSTFLAGNIGVSPLKICDKITQNSKVVLELSSFELEDIKKSPEIAVITSIYADHLDRYNNFAHYLEAKKMIFRFQKSSDILVLDYDNEITKKFALFAPSKIYFYSKNSVAGKPSCFLKGKDIYFGSEKEPILDVEKVKLRGEHNISNILAGVCVAKILKISNQKIKKVVLNFSGVASRQDFIRETKGVKYFNDTTATIPDATVAAIQSFSKRFPNSKIVLVVGGQDKKLEYKELAKEIKNRINFLVFLPGTATEKIKRELEGFGGLANVFEVGSMKEAVKTASKLAKKGDIVLLSPAAASFNLFKNEFDRGNQFIKEVKKLK